MEQSISKSNIRYRLITSIISPLITSIILAIVFIYLKLVPFSHDPGATSLAYDDAYFQFIDFLAFFKDVLSGKQSLGYSFSNYLGQSDFALFTYYLSSPVNLLLVFFDKHDILSFFDLIIYLKICVCAFTFSFFLSGRYGNRLPSVFNTLLSVGYALMQYNLHQCYNYEYLDGVYMLPLMMLGVYKAVKEKKTTLLSVSAACSLLFNWYTGCINCVFSFFFWLAETALYVVDLPKNGKRGEITGSIFAYIRAMLPGVLISFVFLIPTVFELRQGKAADGVDWYILKDFIREDPLSVIRNQYITSGRSGSGMLNTVFCGSAALLGTVGIFSVSDAALSAKKKLVYAGMLLFILGMYCLSPLYLLFSLLKQAAGHTGRYLYLGCLIISYMAGAFFCHLREVKIRKYIISFSAYLALFIICLFRDPVRDRPMIIYTLCQLTVICVLISLYVLFADKPVKRHILLSSIILMVLSETGYNAYGILKHYSNYHEYTQLQFMSYEDNEQELINTLAGEDEGFYRFSQTQNRDLTLDSATANYNESLAFGYASIGDYTSTPHRSQLDFLSRGGYRNEGITPSVVSDFPIIPLDSLLGVKYELSPYDIKGYKKSSGSEGINGKNVYCNPYVLPLAFKAEKKDDPVFSNNPFEYHQGIVSALTGEEASFYEPVSFTYKDEEKQRSYELELFDGNYVFYGYIPWTGREMGGAFIDINGKMTKPYSGWNSEDMFYIPTDKDSDRAYITIRGYSADGIKDSIFYALDLDAFVRSVEKLQKQSAEQLHVENGRIDLSIKANKDEWLFMSIPFDEGWTIKRNGKKTEADKFEDCMMMIPLEEGLNEIVMEYHIPYLPLGSLCSLLGVILIILNIRTDKHRKITSSASPAAVAL